MNKAKAISAKLLDLNFKLIKVPEFQQKNQEKKNYKGKPRKIWKNRNYGKKQATMGRNGNKQEKREEKEINKKKQERKKKEKSSLI